jgi:endonuclease/exonuclease/phosphatase (EEP) superfamily protein YafD
MAAKGRSSAAVAVGQGFIGFGLVGIGVVATLATILGFFGSTWWLFDFAANFRAHLAVVLLLVALAYSLLFSKATGLFFLAMAVINGLMVLPLYSGSPAPTAGDDNMTIVSFSVGQRASIRDATFRWINDVEPDLVVLLDSTNEWVRAEELAHPYKTQNDLPPDRTFGITILSKDSVETEILTASQVRDSVVRVEAAIGDQPVVIYAVQSRPASNATDADYRDEYLKEVSRMARAETKPTVVVGDFEATPWSHAFQDLADTASLENSMVGFGLQTTWPADRWKFFRIPIDHLLHSSELTTIDRYLGPTFGVDHRPIVVTLGIAP